MDMLMIITFPTPQMISRTNYLPHGVVSLSATCVCYPPIKPKVSHLGQEMIKKTLVLLCFFVKESSCKKVIILFNFPTPDSCYMLCQFFIGVTC
jgi:hypothetical protein